MSNDSVVMHPMPVTDSASYIQGPIQPEVGGLPAAAGMGGHKDADLVRITAEHVDGGSYYAHAQSSPACLEEQGKGAFATSAELLREE
jgi:hypothetical protein